ncbi:hypothetical protein BDY21DRAFT_286508 [Lineolata rhizophorae]|uniref:GYF domain-containing protein n=1 Tax=Lineolata rhizophorae TaxID=578093 RepID=A0A6A6NZ47_9PEZI|nr:hypothetical protein BDY21DRAFT_286508 [Lineolata rhizophorae]
MSTARRAPRPKRAGDHFARTYGPQTSDSGLGGEPAPKKARFDPRNPSTLAPDAPGEGDDDDGAADEFLELDEIGKGGAQTKRSAVNIDGYESDSSEDNFDARAEAKAELARQQERSKGGAAKGKAEQEELDDMFADVDEGEFADADKDDDANALGKKKKGVRFLDESQIEGQVQNSTSGGHITLDSLKGKGRAKSEVDDGESSSASSVSGGDEGRDRVGSDVDAELGAGSKKKHAPKLDAFNMRAENEEGRFDEHGNYIRKAQDPDAVHDSWLEGLSRKDIRRAKEAQAKREEERRRRNIQDDAVLTSDVLKTLILHLEKGETVLEALQRLAKGRKEKRKPWQRKKRTKSNNNDDGDAMDMDAPTKAAEDPAEVRRLAAVEAITGAADQLLARGQPEIYDAERELLIRQFTRETGEDWVEPPREDAEGNGATGGETRQWEYRWSDARDGGERHGPYDGPTMDAWNSAGYFGEGVEFRRVGDVEWSRAVDFV